MIRGRTAPRPAPFGDTIFVNSTPELVETWRKIQSGELKTVPLKEFLETRKKTEQLTFPNGNSVTFDTKASSDPLRGV